MGMHGGAAPSDDSARAARKSGLEFEAGPEVE